MGTTKKIIPGGSISGYMTVQGDKSISIRALLISAISNGESLIKGLGTGKDVFSALKCLKMLGIKFIEDPNKIVITGNGLKGLTECNDPIDCGNSGTTLRLLTGILCGQGKKYILTGDESLRSRPMDRIVDPLRKMGAKIDYLEKLGYLPIKIIPSELSGINYKLPVASAQVKSCLLFAALYASGETNIIEKSVTRNHTELMLKARSANIETIGNEISIRKTDSLISNNMEIPGDISSASYFIVLTTLLKNSELKINNLSMNPTRSGIIDILQKMGADISIENSYKVDGEPAADIKIRSSELKNINLSGNIIPIVIDEIPIIAVAASLAKGKTVVKDAGELRIKESDRITAVCKNLKRMGVDIDETTDGMIINGSESLNGSILESFNDHRIALSFSVAAILARGASTIINSEWAEISYPGFFDVLSRIRETKKTINFI